MNGFNFVANQTWPLLTFYDAVVNAFAHLFKNGHLDLPQRHFFLKDFKFPDRILLVFLCFISQLLTDCFFFELLTLPTGIIREKSFIDGVVESFSFLFDSTLFCVFLRFSIDLTEVLFCNTDCLSHLPPT